MLQRWRIFWCKNSLILIAKTSTTWELNKFDNLELAQGFKDAKYFVFCGITSYAQKDQGPNLQADKI